jgi:phage-related protein
MPLPLIASLGTKTVSVATVSDAIQSSENANNIQQGNKGGTALPYSTAVTIERSEVTSDSKTSSSSATGDMAMFAMSPALFAVSKLIGPAIDTVKKTAEVIKESLKEIAKPFIEVGKAVGKAVKAVGEGIWNSVKTIGKGLWEGANAIASPVVEVGKAIASPFIEAGKSIWNGIKSIFS